MCQDAIVCGCRNACYEYCVPSTVFSLSLSLSLSLSVSFSFSISISISLCPSHFNSDISLPLYKSFGLICFFDMLSAGEPCACLCQNVNAAVLCWWDVSGVGMNQNRSNLIGWAKCPMGDILGSLGYNTTLSQFYAQLWTWLKRPVCRSSPSWSGKQVYWSVLGYHLIVLASGLARNCSAWTVWNQHCSHAARNIVIALVQVTRPQLAMCCYVLSYTHNDVSLCSKLTYRTTAQQMLLETKKCVCNGRFALELGTSLFSFLNFNLTDVCT